jgi:hypothetical protein
MKEIPKKLKSVVPIQKITQVEDWWHKLSKENQDELEGIFTEEVDNNNQQVAIEFFGEFVEEDEVNENEAFWVNHFYEYIVNHEIVIDKKPNRGVCSALVQAQDVIKKGILSKDFTCPEHNKKCQMRELLNLENGERSLRFSVRFKLLEEGIST